MDIQCPFKISDEKLKPTGFSQYILNCVRRYKNRLALIDASTGWSCTYEDVEYYVNVFCNYFQKQGLSTGKRLAMVSLNCPEILFTQLAAGLLGVDLINASPLGTVDELTYCLKIAKCDIILTQSDFCDKMNQVAKTVPTCEGVFLFPEQKTLTTSDQISYHYTRNTSIGASNNLVFYSSGTTGLPKAFQLSSDLFTVNFRQLSAAPWHPPPVNDFDEIIDTKQERLLVLLPIIHIYEMNFFCLGLCCGHLVVTMPRFVPDKFLQALEKYKITYLHLVPSLVSFLGNDSAVSKYNLSHLHSITCASAPLPPTVAAKCKERLRLKDMRQLYGMTEIRTCTWTPYGHPNFNSIGFPLPGTIVRFVDPDNHTVASKPREQGELWVTGVQTGGAYFENEQATRNTFVIQDGVTWCKTGDIGYFDESGFIYLVDRHKELIKYKGMQVSPSEIEAVIRQHPDVVDCAVIGKPDEIAGELPVAFVERKENSSVTAESLKALVKSRLSSYKQLSGGVIFIDQLPRSNTGKLQKRRLRDMLSKTITNAKL